MKCEHCGQNNPDGLLICQFCGGPLPVEYTADGLLRTKYTPPYCSVCKTAFPQDVTFCPNCSSISPDITKHLTKQPPKPALSYIRIAEDYHGKLHLDCPHCGHTYEKGSKWLIRRLGSPIRLCAKCHLPFSDPCIYEWSMISWIWKLYYCFLANSKWALILLVSMLLPATDSAINPWSVPISLLLCVVYIAVFRHGALKASAQRKKQNPNYHDILNKMGYDKVK